MTSVAPDQETRRTHRPGLPPMRPWGYVGASIAFLLIAIAIVGLVGVVQNERVKNSAQEGIGYDVQVEDVGEDLQEALIQLKDVHQRVAFGGANSADLADLQTAYDLYLQTVDRLDSIGISELPVMQSEDFRVLGAEYMDDFLPKTSLFFTDNPGFRQAVADGLDRLIALEIEAQRVSDAGEALTADSLHRVETASQTARVVLISLLAGIGLVGATLFIAAGQVVARLRAANAQEQQAARQLAVNLQTKTDFIADASHELRTPLTVIRGNAELALAHTPDSPDRSALEAILGEAKRLGRLVEDMLFLAQSDADRAPLELEYLPVGLAMNQILGPAESIAKSHGKTLEVDFQAVGDAEIDTERIEQAVLIAVDNAAKYSNPDTTISLRSRNDAESFLITVEDCGPGIAADELPLIFDRFYRLGERRARRQGGAGLGLSIAKSIVESHRGTIGIASEAGIGTTVTIRLPLSTGE